jgi:hypothetical protein
MDGLQTIETLEFNSQDGSRPGKQVYYFAWLKDDGLQLC